MRAIIEQKVGRLFLSIHKYHMVKKKYSNAVKYGVSSRKHMEKLKKEVKNSLYFQIKNKRKFKDILQ